MTKLLLLLSTSLFPIQGAPLLIDIIQSQNINAQEKVDNLSVANEKNTLKLETMNNGTVGLVKQELPYYHLPATIKSLFAAFDIEDIKQNEIYKHLRKITETPSDTEGVIIKGQEVTDYINEYTSKNFGTFNLGQGFGVMQDEVKAFNKSIDGSLKAGHPLILTNQSHSFVISGITINENNPWLSTVTGMNPEKGKMVEVSCQRLTWFNRENTYLIGEKEAISQNIKVKSSEIAIEQKKAEMNNLEDGLNTKAFEIEINLTEITSLQSFPKIKENLVSFELPGFNAQIFKIYGTVEEKQGLVLETSQLPDNNVNYWQGEIKQILEFVDKTTKESIKTWVNYRMVITRDFLGDLNLVLQFLVGAEVSNNVDKNTSTQRLTGKVNLDSGQIFKLNR